MKAAGIAAGLAYPIATNRYYRYRIWRGSADAGGVGGGRSRGEQPGQRKLRYDSQDADMNKGSCTDGSATPVSLGWTSGVRVVLDGRRPVPGSPWYRAPGIWEGTHTGNRTSALVPQSGALRMVSDPEQPSTRSAIPCSPEPAGSAPPGPSSATCRTSSAPSISALTLVSAARGVLDRVGHQLAQHEVCGGLQAGGQGLVTDGHLDPGVEALRGGSNHFGEAQLGELGRPEPSPSRARSSCAP